MKIKDTVYILLLGSLSQEKKQKQETKNSSSMQKMEVLSELLARVLTWVT